MSVELKVPSFGESITEALVARWLRREGEFVARDEPLVVLETDKVTQEIPAPASGRLGPLLAAEGATVAVGAALATIDETAVAPEAKAEPAAPPTRGEAAKPAAPGPEPSSAAKAAAPRAPKPAPASIVTQPTAIVPVPPPEPPRVMPAAERAMAEFGVDVRDLRGTGPGGRILKEDVVAAADLRAAATEPPVPPSRDAELAAIARAEASPRQEELVPMSPLRRKIAERLVAAQREAALLTTFNEVDMSAVAALRAAQREPFEKRYGVKLGLMSFFVKAAVDALKLVPAVNAQVQGDAVLYRNYYDVGVAVGGGRGLVVPVLRDADRLSFAEIEKAIADFASRAKENRLKLEELQGGTFTISNGGVYGSMLSTPIVNHPQSGVLGLHAIQDRPVAREGQVVVRPMMYVALTYDHRIIDGREAVTFLKRIKECIENPARMLLEV